LAQELHTSVGAAVGCQVRFNAQVGVQCYIKLMTDGILLAELQRERTLRHYDTLIIDEAHERSLNIDFLLGYCKQLLPRRPDLKLIITSATIDPDKFSRYFNGAPVIEVSGRGHPIELRYRPPQTGEADAQDDYQLEAISAAVGELLYEPEGDILVFLSGEREIRDTAAYLTQRYPDVTVVPLFARLSNTEQQRIFQPHAGRRVVLATNIAETSLTVPGIRYVVDSGLARISRYSPRAKVQRLPIEPISQANAEQRKGRCGRVAPGVCIRLYTEEDFQQRPAFLEPELLRSHLAEVILRMKALHLGNIEQFDFLDPPEAKSVRDGLQLLHELGALEVGGSLTQVGQQLAQLPLEPRLGRILLEAQRRGVLREVLILAAALSLPDPRERPFEAQAAADLQHRQFFQREDKSDFLGLLRLWDFWQEQQQLLTQGQQRKLCARLFLSYNRLREWQAVRQQLEDALDELFDVRLNTQPADYANLHQSLLAGFLGNIGLWHEEQHYRGVRGQRFWPFPGSVLARKPPAWVLAAELVETSKLYARFCAKIEPEWVEQLAGHLVKRQYLDPHWQEDLGRAAAYTQVSLYNLVLVARQRVDFGRVDPVAAREIFIQAALVEGRFAWGAAFWAQNQAELAAAKLWEHKLRRRDLVSDDPARYAWYDARVPATVHDIKGFNRWLEQAPADILCWRVTDLLGADCQAIDPLAYPESWEANGLSLPLRYQYAPGDADDGVTLEVPLAVLNQLRAPDFNWLIPAWLPLKTEALLRTLAKPLRIKLQPLAASSAKLQAVMRWRSGDFVLALTQAARTSLQLEIAPREWLDATTPVEFQMNFKLLNAQGEMLAQGRDLAGLQRRFGTQAQAAVQASHAALPRTALRRWELGDIPTVVVQCTAGIEVMSYPALSDTQDSVSLRVFDTVAQAQQQHQQGLRRLLILELPGQWSAARKTLAVANPGALALQTLLGATSLAAWNVALTSGVFSRAFLEGTALPYRQADYIACKARGLRRLPEILRGVNVWQGELVQHIPLLNKRLQASSQWKTAQADLHAQLARLFVPQLLADTPWQWLAQYPRYLQGMCIRLERLALKPQRDATSLQIIQPLEQRLLDMPNWQALPQENALFTYRWLLEELRLVLFAPDIRPLQPVSPERLAQFWQEQVLAGSK
jgi:ATP-dependent helicase HrpA